MINALIKSIGRIDYLECWDKMRFQTEARTSASPDELWLVEHNDIFTLGLAGKEEHILIREHDIPIVKTDRGGQVTYHGPNQVVIYILIDIKRLGISIRNLVENIENATIKYLAQYNIVANGNREAPGVYVNGRKIASLGLKIRKGCTYHGLSFNYDINKKPFSYINPCGYAGLQVVNLSELIQPDKLPDFNIVSKNLAWFINQEIYSQ